MKENVTLRKIALVVCMLAILAFAMSADIRRAEAVVIGGPHVCAYYSDATFTTVVGARGTGCCGHVINWGITTPFKKCERLLCPDVICPN
jgi:hypothetical protein